MAVDELHDDLAGALQVTAKELTDVLALAGQLGVDVRGYLAMYPASPGAATSRIRVAADTLREWHVGSRHTTGVARRAGVMERYWQAAAGQLTIFDDE